MKTTVDVTEFTPDCKNCHGTCCVALAFDWHNYKKPAGAPCKNLGDDFRCTIWDNLEEEGFIFCRGFSCYGAGQAVARLVKEEGIPNWRDSPDGEKVELGLFQNTYKALYEDFKGKPAPKKAEK